MDGLEPTGRELKDPAARVLEAVDGDGRHYTVIAFDAGHVGHNALTLNVRLVQSFMEYPMVTGLVELGKSDPEQGWFAYPTGSVWTLFDVLRAYGDYGQVVGMRGALELAWLVGQILVEAGDTGPMQGCFSHGLPEGTLPGALAGSPDACLQGGDPLFGGETGCAHENLDPSSIQNCWAGAGALAQAIWCHAALLGQVSGSAETMPYRSSLADFCHFDTLLLWRQ